MAQIVFTTYQAYPDFSQSDSLVAAALMEQGHEVIALPWETELAAFQAADLIIFRAHWNYHHQPVAFLAWLDQVAALGVPYYNSAALIRWNLDKRYLFDLQAQGVTIPVSHMLSVGEDPAAIYAQHGWESAVIKPLAGASGHLVEHVAYTELAEWQTRIRPQRAEGDWLMQEFRPEIQTQGELSLIFIDGQFSHAVAKRPQQGEFRINSHYKGEIVRIIPADSILAQAYDLLTRLSEVPLYARVDGIVTTDGRFCLIELEVNEPGLYFVYAPDCAAQFAQAICDKL